VILAAMSVDFVVRGMTSIIRGISQAVGSG
jgi:hypothetical protein